MLKYFTRMMNRKRLNSVADVIRVLGGTTRAAMFFRVGASQVSNMLAADEIPRSHHLRLYLHLTDLGYAMDLEAIFGPSVLLGNEVMSVSDRPAA
jgi:hypothetical protein